LTELNDLERAIKAVRYNGRIKAIRKEFEVYKKSLVLSRWERFKRWFKAEE